MHLEAARRLAKMDTPTEARMRDRDAAVDQLNVITKRVGFAAIAGLGVFSALGAYTIPGTTTSSQTAATATSSSTDSSSSDSTSSDVQGPAIPITSSSGPAMTVSGGSH